MLFSCLSLNVFAENEIDSASEAKNIATSQCQEYGIGLPGTPKLDKEALDALKGEDVIINTDFESLRDTELATGENVNFAGCVGLIMKNDSAGDRITAEKTESGCYLKWQTPAKSADEYLFYDNYQKALNTYEEYESSLLGASYVISFDYLKSILL